MHKMTVKITLLALRNRCQLTVLTAWLDCKIWQNLSYYEVRLVL